MAMIWKKTVLHAALGAALILGGGAAWCADEGQQVQMLKAMFRLPEPEWRNYLRENAGMLDQSFFDRVDERIRWSAQNNQIDDAIRFAMVGDFGSDAVGKIGGYRLALILIFQKSGNDELARSIIDNVMLTHPDFAEVKYLRAAYRRADGDIGGAIEDYEALLAKGFKKDEVAYILGVINLALSKEVEAKRYFTMSNYPPAKEQLEKLDYITPGTPFPGISPGTATAVVADPKKFNEYFRLAEQAEKQGRLAEAETQYSRAAAANPKDANSHLYLGAVRFRMGKLALACGDFQRGVTVQPKSVEGWRFLGTALERRYDQSKDARLFADARLAYKKALECKPGDPVSEMSLQRLDAKAPKTSSSN